VLNELDYDQPSDDVGEFVEIYNPGDSAVDLSGFMIEVLNPTGSPVAPFALTGSIPAKGYAVLANTAVTVDAGATTVRFANASNNIQNGGQDGVRIITSGGIVVDALMYETQSGAPPEVLALAEGEPFAGGESNEAPNMSLSRCPNATDTNNNATDFALSATPTPGAANVCP
jgi:5'-nucleotidase